MKKLCGFLFGFLFAVSVCGCAASTPACETPSDSAAPSNKITTENTRITEEQAVEIASRHWGVKSGDRDKATGFPLLIVPVESSNDTIAIALKWLVEDHHYSTVDTIEIDPYTGQIVNPDAGA